MEFKTLPLAPRPFTGESVRSWIARVAARYDLGAEALVQYLCEGHHVTAARLAAIDWIEDSDIECLFARATQYDRAAIAALRILDKDMLEQGSWHRMRFAWCSTCLPEDFENYGEVYERAIWRLGVCVLCPDHKRVLGPKNAGCPFGSFRFAPRFGRQRLICTSCSAAVGSAEACATKEAGSGLTGGWLGIEPKAAVISYAFDLQSDLLRALNGAPPLGPWQFSLTAAQFRALVIGLVAALGWLTWFPAGGLDHSQISAEKNLLADMDSATATEVLGIIASVLITLSDGRPLDFSSPHLAPFYPNGVAANLEWLVHGLPPGVRRWLRVAAQDWGPLAGRRVCEVLDAKEADVTLTLAAGREPETKVAGRRTWGDTVCASAAEKRLRVAAAKRIAARAQRRKAARRRKSNQARDKLENLST
jgi:hypothetical protein